MVKQEATGITGTLANILSKNTLVGRILFQEYKTNKIKKNILLDGNKFILEMHLRRLGFTYSTLYKNRIQKFKET